MERKELKWNNGMQEYIQDKGYGRVVTSKKVQNSYERRRDKPYGDHLAQLSVKDHTVK